MSPEVGWTLVAAVVMVVGLCGVVIPVLPGLTFIWATALVYGLLVGFETTGVVAMVLLSAVVAVSAIKGIVVPARTAEAAGASRLALLGGVVGAIIGFFVIPVIGVVIGALVGVLVAEYSMKGNWNDAWAATIGTAKGFGLSVLIDLVLGMIMIAIWSVWALTVVF